MGVCTLNEFDLLTLWTEVERILNDRPITRLPSEPDDLAARTPSMLLTGCLADGAPPGVFLKADGYRRSWRKTQYLADLFWERWLKEYLHLLQPRSKWHGSSPSLKPGEVVLVKDENTKRSCWPKGVVESVEPFICVVFLVLCWGVFQRLSGAICVRNNTFFGRAKLVWVLVCAPRAAKLRHYANPPAGLVVSQRLCCIRVDGLHFVFI